MEPWVVEELGGAAVAEGGGRGGAGVTAGGGGFGVEGGAAVAEGFNVVVCFFAVGADTRPDNGDNDDDYEAGYAGGGGTEDEAEVGDVG